MALTYGFYNAELVNGSYDRTYDAEDFGAMFDGLISDGVFPTYGKKFKVTKYSELKVKVSTGKAWFNGTWTTLDKAIAISVDKDAPLSAIILQVNKKERKNSIIALAAGNKVTLTNSDDLGVYQYCLAYVRVSGGAITGVENHVGEGDENVTPLATGLMGGGSSAGSASSGGVSGTMSASAYTTGIRFHGDTGFDLTFKDEKGLTYENSFTIQNGADGAISSITNKSTGRSINVSYD